MEIMELVKLAESANLEDSGALENYFECLRLLEGEDSPLAHEKNKTVRQISAKCAREKRDRQMFALHKRALLFDAPNDFDAFMQYIEWNREPSKRFYRPRRQVLLPIVKAFQDINDGKLDLLTVSQPKRTGKAVPVYTKVLTPTGFRAIGNLAVGDTVLSADGKPTKVIGVFPQGKKEVYNVVFRGYGRCNAEFSVECCADHLWTVSTKNDRRKGKERVMSCKEMQDMIGKRKNERLAIAYMKPAQFKQTEPLALSPYIMGQLIGDGSLIQRVRLTTNDPEVVERIRSELPEGDAIFSIGGIEYRICREKDRMSRKVRSKTMSALDRYGVLNKRAWEKSIPLPYLWSSVENRLDLLRGLMDSDGFCGGSSLELETVSEKLADDLCFLVRSLGGRSRITQKAGHYIKNGECHTARMVYRVYLAMPKDMNPFWLKRKAEKFDALQPCLLHFIDRIEATGRMEEMVCIAVDDPSHQYVITDRMVPTHNSTLGEWFGLFRAGRDPLGSSIFCGSGNALVTSFYNGMLDVLQKPEEYLYYDVFPKAKLIATNADEKTIHLATKKRFATITCRSIDGALTGSTEATPNGMLYLDDLVSDEIEANNRGRLDSLWDKVRGDLLGRRLEGCPIVAQGTRYSLYDPIGRLQEIAPSMGWRTKVLEIPALDPDTDESNFEITLNGKPMFTTEYYRHERELVTEMQWRSQFQQEPFELKGLLFHEDELNRYFQLPTDREPDAIVAVCDTAEGGGDSVMMPIAYLYGEDVFIVDVVFDNSTPETTKPECANMLLKHKVNTAIFESNAAGVYFARDVEEIIKNKGGKTAIRTRRTITNKQTRIELASDNIKNHFFFKDKSLYRPSDQYALMIRELTSYTRSGKVKHDDAPDGLSLLENEIRNLSGATITVKARLF